MSEHRGAIRKAGRGDPGAASWSSINIFPHDLMGNSRRLKRALRTRLSRERMDRGYGGIKMSEVLVDFAAPMLDGLSLPADREAFVAALKVASMLWNESVSPSPGGTRELCARLSGAMGVPPDPGLERHFNEVIARGKVLYPDLDRIITDVFVDDDGGSRCTVRVLSLITESSMAK